MSDPDKRKPAPNVQVLGLMKDTRAELLDAWADAFKDRRFCYMDDQNPHLAFDMKRKGLVRVSKTEAKEHGLACDFRGNPICWESMEHYKARRKAVSDYNLAMDQKIQPDRHPDEICRKAQRKTPRPLKRVKPGEEDKDD
jgi:hypothetical protein